MMSQYYENRYNTSEYRVVTSYLRGERMNRPRALDQSWQADQPGLGANSVASSIELLICLVPLRDSRILYRPR